MEKGKAGTERPLTKAEQQRKENYEKEKALLEEKGYEAKDLTIGLVYANVMAFVLGLPIIILLAAGFFLNNPLGEITLSPGKGAAVLVLFFLLIVLHELIHGVSWAIFAKSRWKAIAFGFMAKYMTPYCTCSEALKKGEYIFGGIMPTVVLGLIPGIVSIFTGSYALFIISALMILSGGGDLIIILRLLIFRAEGKEDRLYMDHPYKAGLVVFIR